MFILRDKNTGKYMKYATESQDGLEVGLTKYRKDAFRVSGKPFGEEELKSFRKFQDRTGVELEFVED